MSFNFNNNIPKRSSRKIMSEINVTPLIDIMLVLLVIFMVTAPMLVTGVEVNLPEANTPTLTSTDEPLVISINKKNEIYIMETKIDPQKLIHKLQSIAGIKKDSHIFIKADKDISYGKVMKVIGQINAAGFTQVGLVSDN